MRGVIMASSRSSFDFVIFLFTAIALFIAAITFAYDPKTKDGLVLGLCQAGGIALGSAAAVSRRGKVSE
jgi:hypothetical protein